MTEDGRKVVVVGQGYVGLPLAVRAAEVGGYEVIGFDIDKARVDRLLLGESFIEDIESDRLRRALDSGRYRPTADLDNCVSFDIAVISVPTPLREGLPDLSFIERACELIGSLVTRESCVVLESTTYPGTTTELVAPILERESGLVAGSDFFLGYSPERIDPGNKTWNFENTPKLIAGVNGPSTEVIRSFYDTLVDETVPMSGPAEAELAKLIENTFRHVNIALVNELAMVADELGIDIWESIRGASTKPFGFMPFFPGPGVGGHCIPVDPSFLSWRARRRIGYAFRFVEVANDVNEHMPDYVVRRLMLGLNRRGKAVNGSGILVLGLAYKPNTTDSRQSPVVPIVERLLDLGASIRLADPLAGPSHLDNRLVRVEATTTEAARADAVLLLTDHDAFDLDSLAKAAQYFFDTRDRVQADYGEVEHL